MEKQENEIRTSLAENELNISGNAEIISSEPTQENAESKAAEIKAGRKDGAPKKDAEKSRKKAKKSDEAENGDTKTDGEKENNTENINDSLPTDTETVPSEEASVVSDTETAEHANSEVLVESAPLESAPVDTELSDTEEALHVYGGEESIVDLLLGKAPEAEAPLNDEDDAEDDLSANDGGEEFEEMSLIPEAENEEYEALTESEESEDTDEPEEEPYNPERPRKIDSRFDFVELFIFTLALVMIISSFFFRHSVVTGLSMENTLFDGDHIIISDLFYTPKRGDIIVCTDYTTAIKKPIVKRIIALGGDTVKITREGAVYVNGVLLEEDYVFIDMPNYHYLPINEFTVPEGELFVMGDHRNESSDSRDPYVGTISEDSVLGRVLFRFYPFDRFGIPD